MTTQLNNIKFELFAAKEHYLAFRQAWKDYINAGKHKPHYEEDGYGGKVKVSNLTAAQQLLFCILTEKDLSVVFRPSSNPDKENGFEAAYWRLRSYIRSADEIIKYEAGEASIPSYISEERYASGMESRKANLARFLEPFGKGVTVEMMAKLYEKLNEVKLTNLVNGERKAA